ALRPRRQYGRSRPGQGCKYCRQRGDLAARAAAPLRIKHISRSSKNRDTSLGSAHSGGRGTVLYKAGERGDQRCRPIKGLVAVRTDTPSIMYRPLAPMILVVVVV